MVVRFIGPSVPLESWDSLLCFYIVRISMVLYETVAMMVNYIYYLDTIGYGL